MTCQAILFDAGNTLLHVHPSVGAVYAAVAARHGVQCGGEALESAFRRVWSARTAGGEARPSSDAIERAWWRETVWETFAEAGAAEAFGERFDRFFGDLFDAFAEPMVWRLYPDVYPALETIKRRNIRCAIVSNWDSRLPRIVAGLGVAGYFEFILTSAEAGERKPGAVIFQEALRRLALPPEAVIHVGDSEQDDAAGARNAGIKPVLVQRSAGAEDGEAPGSVTTLLQLTSHLAPPR